jgi:membrane-anchored mycosin MYCP
MGSAAAALGLAAIAAPAAPSVPSSAQVRAAEGPSCDQTGSDGDRTVTGENDASNILQVPAASTLAAAAGRRPGAGVSVVVVDSPFAGLDASRFEPLETEHGVVVAGIVGGRDQLQPVRVSTGIAPGARLVERPFYSAARGSGEDKVVPTSDGLAAILTDVAAQVRRGDLGRRVVVLVPMEVPSSPGLVAALDRLDASGALVVAAAGDRTEGTGFLDEFVGGPRPGEDAARDVWPAADPAVVAVGVSTPDATGAVLRNSGVDLSAPGTGSVSMGLSGGWCVVASTSTHWAAAQVAGVAALVWSVHQGDDADRLRARLEGTASGDGAQASPLTGFGMVQAVEALQRPVEGMDQAAADGEDVPRGKVPAARADAYAEARHDAVWWGLAGGGAVAVLLVLRPVLARRRR